MIKAMKNNWAGLKSSDKPGFGSGLRCGGQEGLLWKTGL